MTSIEWLVKELYTEMNMSGDGRVLDEILEQAKEMHKQEIIDAFDEGWKSGYDRCTLDSKDIQDSDMKEPLFTLDIPTIIKQPKKD